MEDFKAFPVTYFFCGGAVLVTLLCQLGLTSPFSLYFSLPLIMKKQWWRIFTCFFFFSATFSIDFIFHILFMYRYCRSLEEGSFRGRPADFFWFILISCTSILILAPILDLPFLGPSLTFAFVYLWSRRNPWARMALFGLFELSAPFLPWALLGVSVMLGSNGIVDLVGIAVGHLYFFLEDMYPQMIPSKRRLLKTPAIMSVFAVP